MISVNNICVRFTGKDLFKGISFVINPKDRIGLVGKNGVGKSTLLKIIAGQNEPDEGSVTTHEGKTIGYLPQEIKNDSTLSIYDETLTVFKEAKDLEKEIEYITKQLETRTDYESESYTELITQLTEKHERFNLIGGNELESDVGKILKGLGFKTEDFERPMSEFSGGWQMRVELAKLLLQMPSLLLLDEPTNHLDIESILWLEQFFNGYPGALMMVSHDRAFLDNVTNRTVEIVFGKTYDYKVPYSKYFELREERLEHQKAAYDNQQKYIAQQEKFIERFKAKASKAKAAQSKMKQLEKIELIEFDELDTSSIQFQFPPAPRSGDVVVSSEKTNKAYGESVVLKNLGFAIERGEKVAFVGKNGEGKSTLVKMIIGEEDFEGDLKQGYNVELGYYAQVQENTLDENITVLETIENEATGEWAKINKIRGLLGTFLFDSDDIEKKVKVLSGGEKSRLALAKLLLKPINLLILDEPTNHLDIASKEILKKALKDYDGTLIVVSHDRDFLEGLTDKTFEFKNQGIKEHLGDISEFLNSHKIDTFREFEADKYKTLQQTQDNKKEVSENKKNYTDKKELEKQIRKLKNAISKAESNISSLETKISEFEKELADPELYQAAMDDKNAFQQYESNKRKLEKTMEEWEQYSTELEELN